LRQSRDIRRTEAVLAAPAPTLIVASASAAFVAFALAPTEAFAPLILENTMPLKTLGVIAMSNGVTSDFDHAAFDPKNSRRLHRGHHMRLP
jgi:hypothetical protein